MNLNNEKTLQKPIISGYGARTTAEEVVKDIDLKGKNVIVTGGYSGLGLEVSRVLSKAGAHIIVPTRSLEKAKKALDNIKNVEIEELNLSDPLSIDKFANKFEQSKRELNILINCAGVMAIPEERDSRGYEMQFSTNHLGHFQLTARLFPALKRANGARIVSLSSGGHALGGINFEDINYLKRKYDKWEAYGQSKTANALFALELDKRGKSHGIRAFSVHPGSIVTNLSRFLSDEEMESMGAIDEEGRRAYTEFTEDRKTIEEGAATIVWCAVSKDLNGKGGVYCQNVDIAPLVDIESSDDVNPRGVYPWAVDEEASEKLWTLSENLTGVNFKI